MDFSGLLMILGILCMILSFFTKDSSKKVEKDVEELSISIYQETNSIKRRLKVVEEELLLEPNFHVKSPVNQKQESNSKYKPNEQLQKPIKKSKPINEILVRQVIELDKQSYSLSEISKLSSLSEVQITNILHNNGGNK